MCNDQAMMDKSVVKLEFCGVDFPFLDRFCTLTEVEFEIVDVVGTSGDK